MSARPPKTFGSRARSQLGELDDQREAAVHQVHLGPVGAMWFSYMSSRLRYRIC